MQEWGVRRVGYRAWKSIVAGDTRLIALLVKIRDPWERPVAPKPS